MQIFTQGKKLLLDIFYEKIIENLKFTHFRSVFNEEYYNFILPKVETKDFSFSQIKNLEKEEAKLGKKISYYILENLLENYKSYLESQNYELLWDDVYMFKKLNKKYDLTLPFEIADIKEKEEMSKACTLCFPDWPNNGEFVHFSFKINSNEIEDKFNKNIILRQDGKIVCFGSIFLSKSLKLAFLHNTGTIPEYRLKGFHHEIIKYGMNLALQSGIEFVYCNVEDGGKSYQNMVDLGFEKDSKFYVFVKK